MKIPGRLYARVFFSHGSEALALKNGLDLYSLSRLLGHESVRITQRYLEAVRDEQVLTSAKKTGVLAHL